MNIAETMPFPWWGIPAIVVGFSIVFPLFWCAIVWTIGLGWRAYAAAYPETSPPSPEARRFTMQTGVIGGRYGNTLTIVITKSHLHLRPMILFSIGHPPIAIPWERIREVRPSGFLKGFFLASATLMMPDGGERTIRLPNAVWEASPVKIRT
jgi:hypothetical protein